MKTRTSIVFKASILIIVFLLNTVIGFACTVGLKMGFNQEHHHQHDEKTEIHVHHNGKTHQHQKIPAKGQKENCCKDEVAKISKTDKLVQRNGDDQSQALSIFVLPASSYFRTVPADLISGHFNALYLWLWHPSIADIRIAIQSFQI